MQKKSWRGKKIHTVKSSHGRGPGVSAGGCYGAAQDSALTKL